MVPPDLAQSVTMKCLDLMAQQGSGWVMPWSGGGKAKNFVTRKSYRGVNVLITGLSGFGSPFFGSYRQWSEAGAQVTKGSKAIHLVFYKPLEIKDKDTDEEKTIRMLRTIPVFNEEQTTGGPKLEIEIPTEMERHETCEKIIAAAGAVIRYGGDKAFYRPSTDEIHLPKPEQFHSRESFYGTSIHEHVHRTGHPSRLDRNLSTRFGSEAYAVEEIIAEGGSAITLAAAGISPEPRIENAQYLNSWAKVLKADKRAILTIFAKAQQAADYLLAPIQPSPADRPDFSPEANPPTRSI
jgi:antirestriction protein ArdC